MLKQKAALSDGYDKWLGYFRDLKMYCAANYGAIEFVLGETSQQFLEDAKTLKEILSEV